MTIFNDTYEAYRLEEAEMKEACGMANYYDKQLQAKDAQIKQLVTALRMAEWSGVAQWGIPPRCPRCFVRRGKEHRADCEIGNAIKEATNG